MEGASNSALNSSSFEVITEIEKLKESFGKDCKVIKDVGDFSYIIQVILHPSDCKLKFQLKDTYPDTHAEVIILPAGDKPYDASALHSHLSALPTITDCLKSAQRWLAEHVGQFDTKFNLTQSISKQKNKKKFKRRVTNEDKEPCKKLSMKTSEDVIKRILWDDSLKTDDFIVGYLDRFMGIVEKPFSTFSWEDISSVDYTVLAIPKHRIQYFKHRDTKVWDKNERLDNFFGSLGSGITITEVVNSSEADKNDIGPSLVSGDQFKDETCTNDDAGFGLPLLPKTMPQDNISDGDYESSDEEDNIIVNIGSLDVDNNLSDYDEEYNNQCVYDEHWRNKMRPNYFLCQRITDENILESVASLQDAMLERTSTYDSCIIPPASLHITLCTLGLNTPELLAEAIDLLHSCKEELQQLVGDSMFIECDGVGNFYERVIYAKVKHNDAFVDYVNHLRSLIREAGLDIRDNHEFIPHLTLLKVTRPVSRLTGSSKVPSWMYGDFSEWSFGRQKIDGIYLCEMKADKDANGFYFSPAHIEF